MSTPFKPIQIPPGVVAMPTKKMRSSNWAEVNMIRWREGQLMPMGGQQRFSGSGATFSVPIDVAFATGATMISVALNPGTIAKGMSITNATTGNPVGTVAGIAPGSGQLTATAAFAANYRGIWMPPNPGWVIPNMPVTDVTHANLALGTVLSYGPFSVRENASAHWTAGATSFTLNNAATFGVIPGLTIFDQDIGQMIGVVASVNANTVTTVNPLPVSAQTTADSLLFSSGANHVLMLNALLTTASAGANDVLSFGQTDWILTLSSPSQSASVGANDLLSFSGNGYLFASRCKRIHGWFDLDQVYHIAYLCEQNLYIDTHGTLVDVTPVDGMTPPSGLVGGFGDALYMNPPPPDDLYGTPRPVPGSVAITKIPDAYSLDNMGSVLFAMTSADGRLLKWDPSVGGPAVIQAADATRGVVPHGRCFVITQERFLMILGSYLDGTPSDGGSFRRFAWCDQENPGAWDYTNVTSQAGFLDVEPASPIVTADATRMGVLFWTGKKAYVSQFLGLPYIYNYVEIGDACTPWSPQSVVTTTAMTLWMAEQGMFAFDGTSVVPIPCKVRPWVDDDIDPINVRELSFACHLADFNEWWWCFPTLNSPFNTRAVVYNYKEGWFSQCQLSRSAGITSSYTAYPIFADDYVAFQHEVFQSTAYQNASMPVVLPFAESFDLNLNSGARLTTIKQLLPDVEAIDAPNDEAVTAAIENLSYSVLYRRTRSIGDPEISSPGFFRDDGYIDFRVTGRDLRLRIDIGPTIRPFTLGQHLIDAVPRGDR
jgi:hypothetical protein